MWVNLSLGLFVGPGLFVTILIAAAILRFFRWQKGYRSLVSEGHSLVKEAEAEKKAIKMMSDEVREIDKEIDKLSKEWPTYKTPAYYAREKVIADLQEKRKILATKIEYVTSRRGKQT